MKNFEQFILDLKDIISYNTTLSSPALNAPFGENTAKCLNRFLDIAKGMGFETFNYDNYMGEVRFGCGEEIGIMGHLDVVPAGEGWSTNPYELCFVDGYYQARGVSDDKGPTLLVLYALKELKDSGIKVNKTFRLFVGTNEETGWKDVEYFNKIGSFCEYGFSPDGNFPVVYAEKGIAIIKFFLPKFKNFENVKGGSVINAVCANAKVDIKKDCAIDRKNIDSVCAKYNLKIQNDTIISVGKSAHSSHPELGVNALKPLLLALNELGEDLSNVIDCLFNDKYNLGEMQNEQGKLTFSPDLIYQGDNGVIIESDCRIPAPITSEDVEKKIKEFNIPYEIKGKHPPVMVDKDGWFVNALISAYNSQTGENAKPVAMGGSTFARVFKKGCAFGMEFDGEDTHMHEIDERVSEKSLLKAYDVYLTALQNLCK